MKEGRKKRRSRLPRHARKKVGLDTENSPVAKFDTVVGDDKDITSCLVVTPFSSSFIEYPSLELSSNRSARGVCDSSRYG